MYVAFNVNGQNCEPHIHLFAMNELDADNLIRKNLRRLIDKHQLQQNKLAEAIGVVPSVINDILAGRRAMGKDTMARICKAMKVDLAEFYWTEDMPVAIDDGEREALRLFRQMRQLGIAEEVTRYETFRIADAKKTSGAGAAGKKKRLPRDRHT